MSIAYVLYNPYSDNNTGKEKAENVRKVYDKEVVMTDITAITSYADFFGAIAPEDEIIVSGGDGTLNRFINDTDGLDVTNDVLYFATGTGNDFLRDMEKQVGCAPFSVKEVIRDLPIVTVKGKDYRFINGVGFGIDGYCCEVGDKIREKTPGKPINYTAIAIKGLLFHYKPANAKVTVDGVEHSFKKVWIAPTMVGRYYGGGMMPAPGQRREDRLDHVSVSLMYQIG
ncbi:MAG: diacylglycerol kinase family protein, partial [Ruminococcaceae bacterium]|nr:diacylglycerol kinase family protein [Oscillospiraceae bacterium]